MTLFCAANKSDSVSLFRFPFLCHVQVYSCEISPVGLWKYPLSCFSSHFCFLVIVILLILVLFVLFLVAVICFCFFYAVFDRRIDLSSLSSVLASPLPPPFFLDIYSLSMSSLECKALCIVISFLILWSTC